MKDETHLSLSLSLFVSLSPGGAGHLVCTGRGEGSMCVNVGSHHGQLWPCRKMVIPLGATSHSPFDLVVLVCLKKGRGNTISLSLSLSASCFPIKMLITRCPAE